MIPVQTECSPALFEFPRVESRSVTAGFDGGRITSDAGALLLGAANRVIGLTTPAPRAQPGASMQALLTEKTGAISRRVLNAKSKTPIYSLSKLLPNEGPPLRASSRVNLARGAQAGLDRALDPA